MSFSLQGKTILFIDDDSTLNAVVEIILSEVGCVVHCVQDGEAGLRKFYQLQPDLTILDIMMPGLNGWEVCRQIRLLSHTPIIMLTTLNDNDLVARSLDAGADDFLSKPFNSKVLVARVRAVLRRAAAGAHEQLSTTYHDDYLMINLAERLLQVGGQRVQLTATEFRLLAYLVRHIGQVLTYEQILYHVWGQDYRDSVDYVHVYLSRLRQKLEVNQRQPQYLLTEYGVGYRFCKPMG